MYRKPTRTVRITLDEAGEPDVWCEVEHPETMSWKSRRRFASLTEEDQRDAVKVATVFLTLVRAWNVVDPETNEELSIPPKQEDLDKIPAHVVEGILTAINALNNVPK